MTTPLVTVANSIIEFILSLLRDPAALAELNEDPDAALAKSKVAGICADDVRAVAPIIYDRPDVVPRASFNPASSDNPPNSPNPAPLSNDVLNEITRITNNWTTIDNRATIVDQSVNQNIWTDGGDVTQIFDQAAGVASGDGSTAAGDDVTNGPPLGDDADDDPATDIPGLQDVVDQLGDGLDQLDAEPGVADDAPDASAPEGAAQTTEGLPPQPTEAQPAGQLTEAQGAGVPPEAAAAAPDAAAGGEPPAAEQVYEAPVAEVDDAVWSEQVDNVEVEEVAYPDELGEEQ